MLTVFSTLFFSAVLVFGAFNINTNGGEFEIDYTPTPPQYYSSTNVKNIIKNNSVVKIQFDYENHEGQ